MKTASQVTIMVNGVPTRVREGETVYGALAGTGVLGVRTSRVLKEPRGFFCGMGVCFECLVTVDGVPGQRACMTEVREGMEVITDE